MKNFLIFTLAFFLTLQVNAQQNIYINQVGYFNNGEKYVLTDYPADSFAVFNTVTKDLQGIFPFKLKKDNDPCSGMNLYRGDFSSIATSGNYIIQVYSELNSGITSFDFQISDTIYNNLLRLAHKSLYLQRCGVDISEEYAGRFSRETCHVNDAEYHHTCQKEGKHDVVGGWHDAGDYGKYIAPGSVTIGLLLTAYEINPTKFNSDQTDIPESNNGIPDFLDEVKFELDWMLKMQREDGAVHEKAHSKDYVQFVMPSEGHLPRYIYEVSSTATADFSAIMAKASRVFQRFDKAYAAKLLKAAKKSYDYLEAHPEVFPEGGFKNPEDTHAGGYSDSYDKDERIWAAAEMYLSTNKNKYLDHFTQFNQEFNFNFSEVGWNNSSTLGFYSLLMAPRTKENSTIQDSLKSNLKKYCEHHLAVAENDGFGIAMLPEDYVWGSNGNVLNKAINLLVGHLLLKKEAYKNLASQHIDYILGANPNQISYVTGVGSRKILHLHHAPSVADLIAEPIPGILSGGPNKYRNDESLVNTFAKGTPPARIFLDNEESYSSNENTIYTNASLVFVASYLNDQ